MPLHPPGPEGLAGLEGLPLPLRPVLLRPSLLGARAGLEGLPLLLHRLSLLRPSRLVVPVVQAGLGLLAHPEGPAGQECLDRLWLPETRLARRLPLPPRGLAVLESPDRPLNPAAQADLDRPLLLEAQAALGLP
jgi:hypothetical protein